MKKILKHVLITIIFAGSFSIQSIASPNLPPITAATPVTSVNPDPTMARLNEIKSMDKSKLTHAERKALRKEVKAIKDSKKDLNGGVYLSVGAIIIIVLLLILLV